MNEYLQELIKIKPNKNENKMYPNKLTTSSTYHQFVLSQQDCKMSPCKNKNSTNVNIQKCVESKIIIQVSN